MGKTKKGGGDFSAAKPSAPPEQQFADKKTNHLAKEQQAVTLINQCKPQEAEATYRALITAGTTNHTAYGHLAAT